MVRRNAILTFLLLSVVLSIAVITFNEGPPAPTHSVSLPKPVVRQVNEALSLYYQKVVDNASVGNFTLALELVERAPPVYPDLNEALLQLVQELWGLTNSSSLAQEQYYLTEVNGTLMTLDALLSKYSLNVSLSPIYSLVKEFSVEVAQEEGKLVKTRLELDVTSYATPGGRISITGRLTTYNGTPLSSYEVLVTVLDKEYSVVTDSDGVFSLSVTLPQVYVREVPVTAYFPPTGDYAGSSATLAVTLEYYQPVMVAYVNETRGLVGQGVTLYFDLESVVYNNTVVVSIANSTYTVRGVEPNVTYSLPLTLPDSPGLYTITVTSLPSGDIAPATASLAVNVSDIPVRISLDVPGLVVAGLPASVSGHTSPGFSGEVEVDVGGTYRIVKVTNGTFSVSIEVPITQNFGLLTVSVHALPPYSGSAEASVLLVNVVDFFPLGVAGYLAYYALSTKPVKERRVAGERTGQVKKESEPRFTFTDPVALAYYRAVTVIERLSGEPLKEHYTVREYLHLVRGKVDENRYYAFWRLTLLFELRVYGDYPVSPSEVRELLKVIES